MSKLEEEFKTLLVVLDIPPLASAFTSEDELVKKLNEKDKFIENLKAEFVNKYNEV